MENVNKIRQEWVEILQALNKLEIKGQENVLILFSLINFVQKKIVDIDKEEPKGE